jgi:hypothetical protein
MKSSGLGLVRFFFIDEVIKFTVHLVYFRLFFFANEKNIFFNDDNFKEN